MAHLYANENFPLATVEHLRKLGHDVLTTHETGRSNLGVEDEAVVRYAREVGRCVVTLNRKDFIRLHRIDSTHAGIIVCTENRQYIALAERIDAAILGAGNLRGQLVRVVRGDPS